MNPMKIKSSKKIKMKRMKKVKVMNHPARKMMKTNLSKINQENSLIWRSFT